MSLDHLSTDDPDDPVDEFIEACETYAATPRLAFAADTLYGIAETVKARRVVTANQRQAVANIVASAERSERTGSRRYEGWRR